VITILHRRITRASRGIAQVAQAAKDAQDSRGLGDLRALGALSVPARSALDSITIIQNPESQRPREDSGLATDPSMVPSNERSVAGPSKRGHEPQSK